MSHTIHDSVHPVFHSNCPNPDARLLCAHLCPEARSPSRYIGVPSQLGCKDGLLSIHQPPLQPQQLRAMRPK
jgi:hypothetical protein